MNWIKMILIASDLPAFAAGILAMLCLKKADRTTRLISFYIIFSSVVQLVALIFWTMHWNNMPLLHIYSPVGFILLMWFYSALLDDYLSKGIIVIVSTAFLVFSCINTVFFQKIHTFNSNALTAESILLIIISIFSFIVFLDNKHEGRNDGERRGFILINSGIFLYHASDLLLFYYGAYIMTHVSTAISSYTWAFHAFFATVMNCMFIVGLWQRRKIFH